MREIKLLKSQIYLKEQFKDGQYFCYDEFSNKLYIITSQLSLFRFDIREEEITLMNDLKDDLSKSEILSFEYILEIQSLVMVQRDGAISQISFAKGNLENMGQFDSGICCASWSSSQEQLVVLCGDGKLVSFDTQLDPTNEVQINDMDSGLASISWSGDAKFFSLNYPCKPSGRICETYESSLQVFQSQSKADPEGGFVKTMFETPNQNLTNGVAWQPAAGYIAGYEVSDKSKLVIFWEKNGLRHLEFELHDLGKSYQCKDLKWSPDSQILALHLGNEEESVLCLYMRSNYKWYLKRVIRSLSPYQDQILHFQWQQTSKSPSLLVANKDQFEIITLLINSNQPNPTSLVISTDGDSLLLSDFSQMMLPPPMFKRQLKLIDKEQKFLGGNIVESISNSDVLLVLNSSHTFFGYKYTDKEDQILFQLDAMDILRATRVSSIRFIEASRTTISKHFYGSIIVVAHDWEIQSDIVIEILLKKEGNKISILQVWRREFEDRTSIYSICPSFAFGVNQEIEENDCYIKLFSQNGIGQNYHLFGSKSTYFTKIGQFETNIIQAQEFKIDEQIYLCYLTISNQLVLNNQVLSNECSSLMIFKQFVVFTANTPDLYHLLYVLDLKKDIRVTKGSLNQRNTERGSKIIAIPSHDKVVVQVPRGNLECISHRILTLHQAYDAHQCHQYDKCYDLLRRYKLDMNLIYDFNPSQFMGEISVFLQQINNQSKLQIFVQSIENSISKELQHVLTDLQLKSIEKTLQEQIASYQNNKVNLVCQMIIDCLSQQNNDLNLLTIITAHSKKQPQELEQALKRVMVLREKDFSEQIELPPHLNPETGKTFKKKVSETKWDQALEFVCWLADANKIYEVALGTYDFDLVKLVAQYTQKDPKEYLPYIESLVKIGDEIDRHARVQLDLKNYEKAIQELSGGTADQRNQAIILIRDHQKFLIGIEIFRNDYPTLIKVKQYLGDYLKEERQYNQASLAYESVGLYLDAINASKDAMDTKRLITLIKLSKVLQENQEKELLSEYVQQLKDQSRYQECGQIYYRLNQTHDAIYYFSKGEDWKQVQKCLINQNAESFKYIDTIVEPALKLSTSVKSNQMIQLQQNFKTKLTRLNAVKLNKQELGNVMVRDQNDPEFDVMSDISMKSGITKSSYTMSVTTGVRKKKVKNGKSFLNRNIKEGSPVEEEYLVENLRNIQQQAIDMINPCKSLQNYLIVFNQPLLAKQLSSNLKLFLKNINTTIKTIAQEKFENDNPLLASLYPSQKEFQRLDLTEEYQNQLEVLIK